MRDYIHPDNQKLVTIDNRIKVVDSTKDYPQLRGIEFTEEPSLPIRMYELWHQGWDIPTRYCIDANNQYWMDNAHGHALRKVDPKDILNQCDTVSDRANVERNLNLPSSTKRCPLCNTLVDKNQIK